ncbi:peptidoglycan-binding domain-containing protein [Sphingomonas oligophenolica]
MPGSRGPDTEARVRAIQQAHGLTAGGVVSPKCWAALDETFP